MKQRDSVLVIWISTVLTTIVVLIFFAFQLRSPYLAAASVTVSITLCFALLIDRQRAVARRNIRWMAEELEAIQTSLDTKTYHHYPEETHDFFKSLTQTKAAFLRRDNIRKDITAIVHSIALNVEFDKFLLDITPKLLELTQSNCVAFYTVGHSTKLVLKHSMGFNKNIFNEFDLNLGEGFVGSFAMNDEITIVRDIPDDTVYTIRTFLGKAKPRNIMIVPVRHLEHLSGVLVCAGIRSYTEEDREMMGMIKYYLGVAMGNGRQAEQNKRLANELAFQNKLIQDQYVEMRNKLQEKEKWLHALLGAFEDNDERVYKMVREEVEKG